MNVYDAIFVKKTVKNFKTDSISDKVLSQILNYANYISTFPERSKVNFEVRSCFDKQEQAVNHFTLKAPYYFMVTTEKDEDDIINLGLVMEQISLYLLTKDLGSCFVGFQKQFGKKDKDKLVAVLAFGVPEYDILATNKNRRKVSVENFCVFKDKESPDARKILSAAVQAPSRQNVKPWRFVVMKNRIHVFCKKDFFHIKSQSNVYYKDFDMGMMLAHLMIASEEFWYNIEVVKSEVIAEKTLKNNIYMFTVVLTNVAY